MNSPTTDISIDQNRPDRNQAHEFPVRVLVACDWLSPGDSIDPNLKIESLTRSHVVSRVTAPDGRAVVVKYPAAGTAEAGRNLLRELYVYRLASWIPALADVLPKPVLIDEARQVLVLEMLASSISEPWPSRPRESGVADLDFARRLAELMAQWHRATKNLALWPSHADGILHLPDELDDVIVHRSPGGQAFMRQLVADPLCEATLRQALGAYQQMCLIHGDIRSDNWLATRDGARLELKIIDWETSGSGDPAWDVASVISEAILQGIRDGFDFKANQSGWPSWIEPIATTFLSTYQVVGDSALDCDHLVLFTASRLMHVACEWAEYEREAETAGARAIIDQVRALIHNRAYAAELLERWSKS